MRRDDPWKFPILLGAFVLLLVIHPFLLAAGGRLAFDVLFSLALVAVVHALHDHWRRRAIAWFLGVPTMAARWSGYLVPYGGTWHRAIFLIDAIFGVFFFGYTAAILVRAILTSRVGPSSIMGAFCAYLMLGLAWAGLYSAVDTVQPGSFHLADHLVGALDDPDRRLTVFNLYSFMTLTTIGSTQILPASVPAGTLAWIEAMVGQFYVAVFVAGLVGLRIAEASPGPPSPGDAEPSERGEPPPETPIIRPEARGSAGPR